MSRLAVLAFLIAFAPWLLGADDLGIVRSRLEADWLSDVNQAAVAAALASQLENGSWPDIDYERKEGTNWPHVRHLERATLLAKAHRLALAKGSTSGRERLAVASAWEFWFVRDFTNVNWWYNEIGVPRAFAPGFVLLADELTSRERTQGLRLLERARIQGESQNLLWLTEINALRGLALRDESLVAKAYERIAAEIRFVPSEGLQVDFSLLQHRRCLYNHGYGASFAVDASRLAKLLSGTRFALSRERIALVEGLLLDGSQWMSLGPWQDWGARGREIARIGRGLGRYQAEAAEHLLALEPPSPRSQELQDLVARVREKPSAPPLVGARHFWRADFTVVQRPGFYASVRSYSKRVANTDFNGPENLLGHHLADGATTLMTSGGEYAEIFPLWNWQQLPGTTARQHPPLRRGSPRRDAGSRSFVGAACDGHGAMVAFDFERDGLSARKAWFMGDVGLVALGTSISDTAAQPVRTTLNQCLTRGPVHASEANSEHAWLWHDSLAYLPLKGDRIEHETRPRTGSWRRIHANLPDAPVTKEIFTAWIDHGTAPSGASYAYLVTPAADVEEAKQKASCSPVRILANREGLQAVQQTSDGQVGIVFHAPGALDLPTPFHHRLSVLQPCIVLLRAEGSGKLRLSVADPTAMLEKVELHLDERHLVIDLPREERAGSTHTLTLNPSP